MSDDNPYLNNPLHGVGLKTVLHELVTHYGFDILYAYLNIKCFSVNPNIAASEKFLKKTDWAREKVETFYLYQYKNLPAVSSEQFKTPPRERIVPEHHKPREPKVLTIEDGLRLQEKRAKNAASRNSRTGERKGSSRDYNERRSAGHYKSRDDRSSDNSSYYKSDKPSDKPKASKKSYYRSESEVEGTEPKFYKASKDTQSKPAKDPWGNFKGGDDE
ncbi:DNA-binding protein VF530 [Leucothrix sargassi]|nr:DNA-binding protein VF530 [Leucothrix sargassi]